MTFKSKNYKLKINQILRNQLLLGSIERKRIKKLIFLSFSLFLFMASNADADVTLILNSGDWSAVQSVRSGTPPDLCAASGAISLSFAFMLVFKNSGQTEVWLVDPDWHMQHAVSGVINIKIDNQKIALPVVSNAPQIVAAAVPDQQVKNFIHTLEGGHSLVVNFGQFQSEAIPLTGAAAVLRATLGCASQFNINGN